MRLFAKAKKRALLNSKGFTLTEMLATTLILVLASTLMTTGISAAIDTYRKVVKSSNAQLALSTTMSVMRTEIGLATDVVVYDPPAPEGGGADEGPTQTRIYYYNAKEGCWASIENSSTFNGLQKTYYKGLPTPTTPVTALEKDGESTPLVSDQSITSELRVNLVSAVESADGSGVDVSLEVVDTEGNTLAAVGDTEPFLILTRFVE